MRLLGILLAFAIALPALAQTNVSSNSAYQAGPVPLSPVANPAVVSPNVRQLSLQDCIQLALKHNLDLQIDRYNPEISLFGLRADYGAYDPSFFLSGEHVYNESGAQILGGGFEVPGAISDVNSFNSTLSGLLPWGTKYTLGTLNSISDTHGTTTTTANVLTAPLSFTSNTVYALPTAGSPVPVTVLKTNFAQTFVSEPFENSSGSVGITVTQPLLKNFWIDQTRLTIRVAKNRLKYSEQTLRLQVMQTITTLEKAYYDLIYDRENVVVQQKAVELAERLVVENKKKLEVGTLAPLDLQSAEAQAASSRAAVIAAQSQLGTQERAVKQLITDRYLQWANLIIVPTGKLTSPHPVVNLQDSWSKGLSLRPEIVQDRLDVEKAGIQLKYDKNQLLPELDAFATVGYNGSGAQFSEALYDLERTDHPFYTFGGNITVPLANITARNNYRSDKAAMEQVVLTLKKLEETIMVSIDNDIGTIRADFDQVQATRAAREYEEAALDAEQKKLENGKSTTYTVLQVQRDLTNARGSEIQALDTYNKDLSQLSIDEGTTLDRLGVSLEVK
jgi:outer membrane protein TolC